MFRSRSLLVDVRALDDADRLALGVAVVDDLDALALLHVVDDDLADHAVGERVVGDLDRQVVEELGVPQRLEVVASICCSVASLYGTNLPCDGWLGRQLDRSRGRFRCRPWRMLPCRSKHSSSMPDERRRDPAGGKCGRRRPTSDGSRTARLARSAPGRRGRACGGGAHAGGAGGWR